MSCANAAGGLQTLYRIFVLPTLYSTSRAPLLPRHGLRLVSPAGQRAFSQTTTRVGSKYREPEARLPQNEEIKARILQLADPNTGELEEKTVTRYDVLKNLDQRTHRLVQYTNDPIPVCKILNKKEYYDHEKKKKQLAKEKRRESRTAESLKTLELNWAIDENDLGHRLIKVKQFLEQGRRVEIVLAAKKKGRGRQATPEQCEEVLKRIQKVVDSVKGAREFVPLEGTIGAIATVTLQGAPLQSTSSAQPQPETSSSETPEPAKPAAQIEANV